MLRKGFSVLVNTFLVSRVAGSTASVKTTTDPKSLLVALNAISAQGLG
jgi:hypothetical protein